MDIMDIENAFQIIIAAEDESDVLAQVDENKEEYIRDWEYEFDNIHEAYEEQGRGQAEAQAISDILTKHFQAIITSDEFIALSEMLAEHWGLTTD